MLTFIYKKLQLGRERESASGAPEAEALLTNCNSPHNYFQLYTPSHLSLLISFLASTLATISRIHFQHNHKKFNAKS